MKRENEVSSYPRQCGTKNSTNNSTNTTKPESFLLEASALHALKFMTLIWEIYDDLILVMTRKVIVELEGSNMKKKQAFLQW
jgi:hypothetical protein